MEHLWSKSGSIDEIKSLYNSISSNQNVLLSHYSVRSIAKLLVLYFKKMPQPLLTFELHDYFLGGAYAEVFDSKQEHLDYLKGIINLLPTINRKTLKNLVRVFSKVWKEGDIDLKLLTAEIWGPILLLRDNVHDVQREAHMSMNLIKHFINNFDYLFSKGTTKSNFIHIAQRINNKKLQMMDKYIRKLNIVSEDFSTFYQSENIYNLVDFKTSLLLLETKVKFLKDYLVNNISDNLKTIIDTYHLERFFGYLLDFHTSIVLSYQRKNFGRHFSSSKLKAPFERLSYGMQYELNLFFSVVNVISGGSLSFNPCTSLRIYTIDLINGKEYQDFWKHTFGIHNFIGCIRAFFSAYSLYCGIVLDQNAINCLRMFLDENNTGFVSVIKLSKFARYFPNIKLSLRECIDLVSKKWFHGHINKIEAYRTLECYPPGTYIIRFSDIDSLSINFKTEDGQFFNIKIDVFQDNNEILYSVKEGTGVKRFKTINCIIEHYNKFLKFTPPINLSLMPWFYGDLKSDEAFQYLQYEPAGTFMMRFSSHPGHLAFDFITEDGGIESCRVERIPCGSIKLNNVTYENIENFLMLNNNIFSIPYTHRSEVTTTKEDEVINSKEYLEKLLEDNETSLFETNTRKITEDTSLIGRRMTSSQLRSSQKGVNIKLQKEEELKELILKSSKENSLDVVDQISLVNLLFELPQDVIESVQKKTHSKIAQEHQNKVLRSKGIKLSKYAAFPKDRFIVNKLNYFHIKATNNYKEAMNFNIVHPYSITSQFFISVTPSSGVLESGKSVEFNIAIVLYKPVVIQEILTIVFNSNDQNIRQVFSIPIKVLPKKECITGSIKVDDYWVIPIIKNGDILGQGGSGLVKKCDLLGAPVAVKIWDLGKSEDPPSDFYHELNVLLSLKHENLVTFVGAIGKKGCAMIAIEYVDGGSLDKYLQFKSDEEINEALMSGDSIKYQKNHEINIYTKLQMSLDAANGILYLHENNLLHRDIKSLNFLIDKMTMKVKVSDFGESTEKDSKISTSVGSEPWMAPEVYNSKVYSTKSDVFSFGLTLYEILLNSYPIRMRDMIEKGMIPEIPKQLEDEFPDIVQLIRKCCRNNCEKRPSMFYIVRDLENIRSKYQIRQPRRGGSKK